MPRIIPPRRIGFNKLRTICRRSRCPDMIGAFQKVKSKRFGKSSLSYYEPIDVEK